MVHADEARQLYAELALAKHLSLLLVAVPFGVIIRVPASFTALDRLHLLLQEGREIDSRVVLLDLDPGHLIELLLTERLLLAQLLFLDMLLLIGDHRRGHDVALAEYLFLPRVQLLEQGVRQQADRTLPLGNVHDETLAQKVHKRL